MKALHVQAIFTHIRQSCNPWKLSMFRQSSHTSDSRAIQEYSPCSGNLYTHPKVVRSMNALHVQTTFTHIRQSCDPWMLSMFRQPSHTSDSRAIHECSPCSGNLHTHPTVVQSMKALHVQAIFTHIRKSCDPWMLSMFRQPSHTSDSRAIHECSPCSDNLHTHPTVVRSMNALHVQATFTHIRQSCDPWMLSMFRQSSHTSDSRAIHECSPCSGNLHTHPTVVRSMKALHVQAIFTHIRQSCNPWKLSMFRQSSHTSDSRAIQEYSPCSGNLHTHPTVVRSMNALHVQTTFTHIRQSCDPWILSMFRQPSHTSDSCAIHEYSPCPEASFVHLSCST